MTPTLELIESLRSPKGGFTRESLQKLGVGYPPKKGWLKKLVREAKAAKTPDEAENQKFYDFLTAPVTRPAAKRTVKIIFDGGTSCNIPAKGYGNGYGSYKLDGRPVHRCHFGPMSANAAEVNTLACALRALHHMIPKEDYETTDIHALGDSQIALKWARLAKTGMTLKPKGSLEFRSAIQDLCSALAPFRSIRADWWPRCNSVRIFGH